MLMYYQYKGKYFFVNAGAFPRANLKGLYLRAFDGDDSYFDNVFEGALARYNRWGLSLEVAADWYGCFERRHRERFKVYASTRYRHPSFPYIYALCICYMHHYANSGEVVGVVDNGWISPYLGIDFLPLCLSSKRASVDATVRNFHQSSFKTSSLTRLDAKVGWIQTFQNDRRTHEGYVHPGGLQLNMGVEYFGFGIDNTLYIGENLMPFYNRVDAAGQPYIDNLYFGNPFYGTESGLYDRLEIYWRYALKDILSVSISSIHHCDKTKWGWQQMIRLIVNINNFSKGDLKTSK